jgi:hypothetical protein
MNLLKFFWNKPQTIEIDQAPTQLPLVVLKPVDEIPSIGKDNENIITAITCARRVAVELARAGYHVLKITLDPDRPKILIKPSRRCERLSGKLIRRELVSAHEIDTMATCIEGVQVEWTVPHV